MWHHSLRDQSSKPGSISAGVRQLQLPSKLVTEMMNSDSDDSNRDQEQHSSDDEQLFAKAYSNLHLKQNYNPNSFNQNIKINEIVEKQETRSYRQLSSGPPPLVPAYQDAKTIPIRNEKQKQNTPSYINQKKDRNVVREVKDKSANQIKYSCFKVDGNKLIESRAQFGQYNSLNLDEASLIPDGNDLLIAEIDKFKEERKQNYRKITELQNENRNLRKQISIFQEEIKSKDNSYNQLEEQLHDKNSQIQNLIKKISSLQTELSQLNESKQSSSKIQPTSRQFNSRKRQGQLSKYLSNMMDKNSNKNMNFEGQRVGRANQQIQKRDAKTIGIQPIPETNESERIYKEVTEYLVKRIHEFKDRLLGNRMSMAVEEIIEQFMTEIVNINPIAVSRAISTAKSRVSCTPNRTRFRGAFDEQSKITQTGMTSIQPRQSLAHQSLRSNVTPIKKPQDKQKSTQLQNLEKSLHKLREMQKSYTPTVQNQNIKTIANDNTIQEGNNSYIGVSYESLDRSLVGLDRSNRSKSRRKKIFQ